MKILLKQNPSQRLSDVIDYYLNVVNYLLALVYAY